MTAYDLILADPPWHFSNWGADKPGMIHQRSRGANKHYPTMTLEQIKALPVAEWAAKDAVLALWTTRTHHHLAYTVIEAWGFKPVSYLFEWVKPNLRIVRDGKPVTDITHPSNWRLGMGYDTRANTEICLLAKRGKGLSRQDAGVPSLIVAPLSRHSQKPLEQYARLERLYGPSLRRLELFARAAQPGWDVWGNEVEPSIDLYEPAAEAG